MPTLERRGAFASLCVFALAFGWTEASILVYLREIYEGEVLLHAPNFLPPLQITLVSLPRALVTLEMVRESGTLLLLAAVGWLAGRRPADRVGAFLLAFGIWDLTYYFVLRLVLGGTNGLSTWDVLFLIPAPWVAPVWASVTIATLFVLIGSYLFWTPEQDRHYRWTDVSVLAASALLTLVAPLFGSKTVIDHHVPAHFPAWLFWLGVVLGTAWFAQVEQHVLRSREPWLGVRIQTILPTDTRATSIRTSKATIVFNGTLTARGDRDREDMLREYAEHRRRLDALIQEVRELDERFFH